MYKGILVFKKLTLFGGSGALLFLRLIRFGLGSETFPLTPKGLFIFGISEDIGNVSSSTFSALVLISVFSTLSLNLDLGSGTGTEVLVGV